MKELGVAPAPPLVVVATCSGQLFTLWVDVVRWLASSHSDKPGTSARVLYTHLPFRYPTQAIWLALSLSTPGGFSVDVAADQLQ